MLIIRGMRELCLEFYKHETEKGVRLSGVLLKSSTVPVTIMACNSICPHKGSFHNQVPKCVKTWRYTIWQNLTRKWQFLAISAVHCEVAVWKGIFSARLSPALLQWQSPAESSEANNSKSQTMNKCRSTAGTGKLLAVVGSPSHQELHFGVIQPATRNKNKNKGQLWSKFTGSLYRPFNCTNCLQMKQTHSLLPSNPAVPRKLLFKLYKIPHSQF